MSTFTYGSEYLGDISRLVITSMLEHAAMAVTTAISMNTMATVSGAVSTGKTGIIKACCHATACIYIHMCLLTRIAG